MYRKFFKRVIDILGQVWNTISISFLILALAIKLDSKGPVFFKQERLGKRGKVFKIIKFRTMVVMRRIWRRLKSKQYR